MLLLSDPKQKLIIRCVKVFSGRQEEKHFLSSAKGHLEAPASIEGQLEADQGNTVANGPYANCILIRAHLSFTV